MPKRIGIRGLGFMEKLALKYDNYPIRARINFRPACIYSLLKFMILLVFLFQALHAKAAAPAPRELVSRANDLRKKATKLIEAKSKIPEKVKEAQEIVKACGFNMEFNNAIEDYPNYAEAYSNRGALYIQQKKYNKAEKDLKKAAKLKPKDPIIQYNLAALYSVQNKNDLALEALDKSLQNGFNNFDALKPKGKGSDPDLKNLRKDPGFKEVLERNKVFILD